MTSVLDKTLAEIRTRSGIDTTTELPFLPGVKESLWVLAKKIALKAGEEGKSKLLLIFDQFEEMSSFSDEEIIRFKRELFELLNSGIPAELYKEMRRRKEQFLNMASISAGDREKFNRESQFLEAPLNAKAIFLIREDELGTMSLLADVFPDILKSVYVLKALTFEGAEAGVEIPSNIDGDFASKPFEFKDKATIQSLVKAVGDESSGLVDPMQIQIVCSTIERQKVIKGGKKVITESMFLPVGNIIEDFYWESWTAVKEITTGSAADYDAKRKRIISQLVVNGKRNIVNAELLLKAETWDEDLKVIGILESKGLIRSDPGIVKYYQLCHDRFLEPLMKDLADLSNNESLLVKIRATEERGKKQVRGLIYLGVICIVLFFCLIKVSLERKRNERLNNAVQEELLGEVKVVRRINPTLAYEVLKGFKASGKYEYNESFKDNLRRFDAAKDAYLLYTLPTMSDPVLVILSDNWKELSLTDRSSKITWDISKGIIKKRVPLRDGKYLRYVRINGAYYFVIGHSNSSIELVSQSGETYRTLSHVEIPTNVDVSYDGRYILLSNKVYDLRSAGRKLRLPPIPKVEPSDLLTSIFLHNGRQIAAGYRSGYKAIFTVPDKGRIKLSAVIPPAQEGSPSPSILSLVVDSKDKLLIAGNKNNDIEVWKIDSLSSYDQNQVGQYASVNNPNLALLTGHAGEVISLCLSTDDSMLLSGSRDHSAILWNLRTSEKLAILKGMNEDVTFARFFVRSDRMVTATKSGVVYLWDYETPVRLGGHLATFTPFDHYNIQQGNRDSIFHLLYDTSDIIKLCSSTMHYLYNFPTSNNLINDQEYSGNLRQSITQIDQMFHSLEANGTFSKTISAPNRLMLYNLYANFWRNKAALLQIDQSDVSLIQVALLMKKMALVDTSSASAIIEACTLFLTISLEYARPSDSIEKAIYCLNNAASLIDIYAARHFEDKQLSLWEREIYFLLSVINRDLSILDDDSTRVIVKRLESVEEEIPEPRLAVIRAYLDSNNCEGAIGAFRRIISDRRIAPYLQEYLIARTKLMAKYLTVTPAFKQFSEFLVRHYQ
ncbi:MAG TPA: hypothetical protein VG052_07315 [Puia sp.]|jgi:WD40 repeat protein|nr:hypothetical protein [Puia sp.]